MSPNNEKFNKDELDAPKWLNAELFSKVLRQHENNEELEVKYVKVSPASQKGDHYASLMFRVNIDYVKEGKEEHKSLVIKMMPEVEGHKKEMFKESYIFETEIGVYTEVLPKCEEILRAAGDNTKLGAPYIHHSLSPHKYIIFEDLVPMGYTVLRDRDASLEELMAIYTKMGKLQAVSFKLNKENPDFFDKYRHSFMTLPNILEEGYMTSGLDNMIEVLGTEPELSRFIPFFEKIRGKYLDMNYKSYTEYREDPQPDAYYVLCHGDFHIKNMMWKHNSETGKFEDVVLLDFQISFIGSIVLDLMYSIYMLMDREQRTKHRDELMYRYFITFQETLQKIGYDGKMPSLVQFRQQFLKHKHFELFLLFCYLPLFIAFKTGKVDAEELLKSNECRRQFYKNPEVIDELREVLPRYLHQGLFEYDFD